MCLCRNCLDDNLSYDINRVYKEAPHLYFKFSTVPQMLAFESLFKIIKTYVHEPMSDFGMGELFIREMHRIRVEFPIIVEMRYYQLWYCHKLVALLYFKG